MALTDTILSSYEKALKEFYLTPLKNQLGVEPTALLGQIKKVTIQSNKIVATAPVGLSGGFGFGAENTPTPHSGNLIHERFESSPKDMYVNITISEKTMQLTGPGGAMVDALGTEVKAAYHTAKWNVGRSIFGDGTGILATTAGGGTTVTRGVKVPVDSVQYLKEGLIVDFYATGATTPSATLKRIISVDRTPGSFSVTVDSGAFTAPAGFITVQNSYNREITGLGAIFKPEVASIYGMVKADYPWLYPVEFDCGNDISDAIITSKLREAKQHKNSEIDMLLCGDAAYDRYIDHLRENNQRVEAADAELVGGFKAIKFRFGSRDVSIVNESFVPTEEIWGVDTKSMELHQTDWHFCELKNSGVFELMPNTSIYRALLANYGDLICTNPGGCLRLYNCA